MPHRCRPWRGLRPSTAYFFFPDFLMPCCPVFMGPLPPAFFAISSRAFLSVGQSAAMHMSLALPARHRPFALETGEGWKMSDYAPACCFCLNAISSSSSSLFCFLGFLLWIGFVPAVIMSALKIPRSFSLSLSPDLQILRRLRKGARTSLS